MIGMLQFISCFLGLIFLSSNLVSAELLQLGAVQGGKNENDNRQTQYHSLSKYLEALTNEKISTLLSEGKPLHSGYGTSVKLQINGIRVFVKKLP